MCATAHICATNIWRVKVFVCAGRLPHLLQEKLWPFRSSGTALHPNPKPNVQKADRPPLSARGAPRTQPRFVCRPLGAIWHSRSETENAALASRVDGAGWATQADIWRMRRRASRRAPDGCMQGRDQAPLRRWRGRQEDREKREDTMLLKKRSKIIIRPPSSVARIWRRQEPGSLMCGAMRCMSLRPSGAGVAATRLHSPTRAESWRAGAPPQRCPERMGEAPALSTPETTAYSGTSRGGQDGKRGLLPPLGCTIQPARPWRPRTPPLDRQGCSGSAPAPPVVPSTTGALAPGRLERTMGCNASFTSEPGASPDTRLPRPNLSVSKPRLVELGRFRATWVDSGPNVAAVGRDRPSIGREQPELGSIPSQIGQCWPYLPQIGHMFGRLRPGFDPM